MSKMRKCIISGVFRTGQAHMAQKVDFDGVVGYMPVGNEENILSHILYRIGAQWIKDDARYAEKRCEVIEQVFVDNGKNSKGEIVDYKNPIIGKSLKDLNWPELQMFAIHHNLLGIPVPNQCSLRDAKEKAYKEYYSKVKMMGIGNMSYNDLPDIITSEDDIAVDNEEKISNEEILNSSNPDSEYTIEQLKEMAKQRGIDFHPNIGYKKLYEKLFS